MGSRDDSHDPSARYAGTSPSRTPRRGGKEHQAGPGPLIEKVGSSIFSTPYWSNSLS